MKIYLKNFYPFLNILYKLSDIIFVLSLLLFIFILLLMKLRIRMGLIKRLRVDENSKIRILPLQLIFFYFFMNIVIFFFLPQIGINSFINYHIVRNYGSNQLNSFEEKLIKETKAFSPKLTLYKFFESYDVILITQIFLSIIFFYIIIMKVFFDIDFI
ncbi:MAG TPA: hypothetical protein PLD27_10540 [bacterium]|nr:hypothetical protein [bacterium]HOL47637.1 hypothetical protein [bacterium]HPQ19651.1 hypothetical protein [bacterium]